MTAEVLDINGTRLDAAELAPNAREDMARVFEDLAEEARAGHIENFAVVLVRSEIRYSIRFWIKDTLRLVGACEAAKSDLLAASRLIEDEADGTG